MIVECQRCDAQFQLDEGRVPADGVRVRCSRCKYAFRIERPGMSKAERIERAAEQALETGEPAFPDITQDLLETRAAGDESSLGPELADDFEEEESDWEFNDDSSLPSSEQSDDLEDAPEVDGEALAAARDVVDDLLAASRVDEDPFDEVTDTNEISSAEEAAGLALDGRSQLESDSAAPGELDFSSELETPDYEEPVEQMSEEPVDPVDELGSPDEWDFFAQRARDDGRQADDQPGRSSRGRRPLRASGPAELLEDAASGPLLVWMRRFGTTTAWVATAAILAVGLWGGLIPRSWGAAGASEQTIQGLKVGQLGGRWIDNAVVGSIYVVSGTVENAGASSVAPGAALGLELLDRQGRAIGAPNIALTRPHDSSVLREGDPRSVASGGGWFATVPLAPSEQRPFEAILSNPPPTAARFRIVLTNTNTQPAQIETAIQTQTATPAPTATPTATLSPPVAPPNPTDAPTAEPPTP